MLHSTQPIGSDAQLAEDLYKHIL